MRFLYAIGPVNASQIRHFRITGFVNPENDRQEGQESEIHDEGCHLSLGYYLGAYRLFLERYCQNLDSLAVAVRGVVKNGTDQTISIFENLTEDESYLLRQYDEVQNGDIVIEAYSDVGLLGTRKFREEMRFKIGAGILTTKQDGTIQTLQPILEDLRGRNGGGYGGLRSQGENPWRLGLEQPWLLIDRFFGDLRLPRSH